MQLLDLGSARDPSVSAVTAARHTHGLVIGGGLTGLLAARVLANHVDRVTLIDRQPLPRLPELRAGVAPAVYPHVHIARGPGSLDTLLPGLTSELVTSGAALVDPARDVTWLSAGGRAASRRPASAGPVLTCSRELVEWHVRRRVSMLPCVHLLEGVEVFALSANGPRRIVNGVHVRASDRGHASRRSFAKPSLPRTSWSMPRATRRAPTSGCINWDFRCRPNAANWRRGRRAPCSRRMNAGASAGTAWRANV